MTFTLDIHSVPTHQRLISVLVGVPVHDDLHAAGIVPADPALCGHRTGLRQQARVDPSSLLVFDAVRRLESGR